MQTNYTVKTNDGVHSHSTTSQSEAYRKSKQLRRVVTHGTLVFVYLNGVAKSVFTAKTRTANPYKHIKTTQGD